MDSPRFIAQAWRFGGPLGKRPRGTALHGAQVGFQPAEGKKTGQLEGLNVVACWVHNWEKWYKCELLTMTFMEDGIFRNKIRLIHRNYKDLDLTAIKIPSTGRG